MTLEDWEREINARPEDALLRLAFADWLDECGDDRAEGIRVFARCGRVPCGNREVCQWWWWDRKSSGGAWTRESVVGKGWSLGLILRYIYGGDPRSGSPFAAFMFAAETWRSATEKAKRDFLDQFLPKETEAAL